MTVVSKVDEWDDRTVPLSYVDSLVKFDNKKYKGMLHIVMDDAERILELAIPPVELSSAQADAFQRILEYASEKNIVFKTVIIE